MANKFIQSFNFSRREVILVLLGGMGFFFGLPNPIVHLPLCMLLFPFALSCLALEAQSEGRAVSATLGVTLTGGGLAVHWVVYPMINFGGVPLPLAIFFMLLLVALLSVYYVLYTLLLRFYSKSLPGLMLPLIAAALTWGALEYLRGWFLTGVSWCALSSSMLGWPVFAQAASVLGMYGLSALYAFAALCFLPLFSRANIGGKPCRSMATAVLGCTIVLGLACFGFYRINQPFNQGKAVIIAQVQGNIDQAQKWNPAKQLDTAKHYLKLSQQALSEAKQLYDAKPDLLLWPETSMPFHFQQPGPMPALIRDFVRKERTPLAFGVPAKSRQLGSDESYNRVWLLDENGSDAGCYDKEHLVPFGEYIPKGLYVPFASEFLQGHGFTPGTAKAPIPYRSFRLGVLICYEAIFPELAQARVQSGANILINVSNDAWFANSPAPWQHLHLAAMRCIEQGRYMLRSTNTGLSAMIDPTGQFHGLGPLFQDYTSAHKAYLLKEKTFFHKNYRLINLILAYSPFAFIILGLVMSLKRGRKV